MCSEFTANDSAPHESGQSLGANGVTYDWDANTNAFSIRAYEEQDVAVDVMQPSITKRTSHKLLKKAKIKEVSAPN